MITLRSRTLVAFLAGVTLSVAAGVTFQAWRAAAAPGHTDTTFVPITPCRLLDTREPAWNIWGPNVTQSLPVHGAHGSCTIPIDAVGLSMNVTAVRATEPTFLTIWPDDQPMPNASSLNPVPGQPPTPNAVTTELAENGRFRVYNLAGHVHVIIDVNGYYTTVGLADLDDRLGDLEVALEELRALPRVTGFGVLTEATTLPSFTAGRIETPRCPAGEVAVAGGFDPAIDLFPEPVGMDGLWPNASSGHRNWFVDYTNTDTVDHVATLYTICSRR